MALATNQPHDASTSLAAVAFALALLVMLRLAAAARQLGEARQASAERAVLRMRGFVEEELERTLGAELAEIAEQAEQTAVTMFRDVASGSGERLPRVLVQLVRCLRTPHPCASPHPGRSS
ncbi:hypothetical protein AB0M20_40990 [Actinoplanes sp. NPDC051633]|uniref:hypothetical protein n=1 Tax=Actinoplanes sp. NPDC051633 TaxID=3155670 RepID=UPI003417EE7A